MMKKFGILMAGLLISASATAVEFGIVMDMQGAVVIERAGAQMPADFGMAVELGDNILLDDGASATVVSYMDCQELMLNGPARAAADGEQLSVTPPSRLQAGRILPVCYGEEELNISDADIIGGVVLRGAPRDPVHSLRTEFSQGKASTSTLMTLLMHDLANGNTEKARPYFDALRSKAPDSAFLARVAPVFQ
jgi:hypothetical protein